MEGEDGQVRPPRGAASHLTNLRQGASMIRRLVDGIRGAMDPAPGGGTAPDLVLLSGEPFAPGTRVKRVMVNGRFTDEGRPE